MIIGRKAKLNEDLNQIENILSENNILDNIYENDILYVLEENSNIIGVCKIVNNRQIGILHYIIISKFFRSENFGDSLLRAAFNYCVRHGITKIYYPNGNNYLQKIGFVKISSLEVPSVIKEMASSDRGLICDLSKFFSKGCSSCKGR